MNVLFISGCYPKEEMHEIEVKSKQSPQYAANVLQWNIINGLIVNINKGLDILTLPFLGFYPHGSSVFSVKRRDFLIRDEVILHQKPFVNIKGLESIQKRSEIIRYCMKWYRKNTSNRDILVYSQYPAFVSALGKMKKRYPDIQITCILADLPDVDDRNSFSGSILRKIVTLPRRIAFHISRKNLKRFDKFVLLTDAMSKHIQLGNRRYTVVECISNTNPISSVPSLRLTDPLVISITYTGTLNERYGIRNLVEAFDKYLKDLNCQLYICGDGDYRDQLVRRIEQNPRIHYLGVLEHSVCRQLQVQSTILVNPRPNTGIYTELSFPSKTIEYMTAAKPVICFKLGGIPDEYDSNLIYFRENTPEAMAKTLQEVISLPLGRLAAIGQDNFTFASEKKMK